MYRVGDAVKQRTPLVSQYLENISRDALREYQPIIREFVRRRHGIYALYNRNKLYYVGLASNLRSRLKAHLRNRHEDSWDRFSIYLTLDNRHVRELESLAGLLSGKNRLRGWHKGATIKARLRKDGSISLKGKIFNSPSSAAATACGRRTCNGWRFWHYERAPGDWVPLKELRS